MNTEQKLEKAMELLKSLRGHVNGSGAQATNAVYISPSQQMRNAADDMERKDALLGEIDGFIRE